MGVGEEELRAFLDRCVHHRLIAHDQRRWLGLAVHVPAREEPEESSGLGLVMCQATGAA
jgi:hypothetical protein